MIKTYSQAKTIVEQKFNSSPYIISRNIIGELKYFPEEVHYWATKIINCNWSQSLFNTEFDIVYISNQATNLSSIRFNDHIGQTFLVDKNSFPNGLFLSSIFLYFDNSTPDDSPVTLELRPLVNGYPSSTETIPLSSVTRTPSRAFVPSPITYDDNDRTFGETFFTDFVFDFPVYLAEGYYCFIIKTNSSKHKIYYAERGHPELVTGKLVTNPYIGSLVTSQQGISWTIEQTKDLCFVLKRAKFEIGTKNFDFNTKDSFVDFDLLNLTLRTQEFENIAFIDKISTNVIDKSTLNSTALNIFKNKNINLSSKSTSNVTDGVVFNISMTNTSDVLSPLIDIEKSGTVLISNLIYPYNQESSDLELLPNFDSVPNAKYITKKIELNDDFDADGLTVYLDINKPSGTEVEVFYKILNKYDFNNEFKDMPWVRLPKNIQSQASTDTLEFSEESFQKLNLTYSNETGTIYNNFKYFAIKLVMYSDNSSEIPKIKNFRAIATV